MHRNRSFGSLRGILRSHLIVAGLVIGAASFYSQGTLPDEKPTASISGTVFRKGTTEIIAGAHLELLPSEIGALGDYDFNPAILNMLKSRKRSFTAVTDNKGAYSIQGLPAGEYRLAVVRDGFTRTEYLQSIGNDRGAVIRISAGQKLSDVSIGMTPAPTISGTVLDESGVPAAYATIEAIALQYFPGGARRLRLVQTANTDDLGQFRLYWLSPGDYIVAVDYNGGARHEIFAAVPQDRPNLPLPEVDYPTFYYPNTPDLSAAQALHIGESGETSGIDFRLNHASLATLRGTVQNLPNSTIPDRPTQAQILLAPVRFPDGSISYHYRADTNGRFQIKGVAPGSYFIQAVGGSSNISLRSPSVRVEVGSKDVDNIAVPLFAGVKITGTVQVEGVAGPPSFDTSLVLPYFTGELGHGEFFPSRVAPDGTLTDAIGFPGTFQITILGLPNGYYLKQAILGSRDVLESGLHIEAGNLSPLSLILGKNTKTVSGTVTGFDNRPSAGAAVVLIPAQEFRNRADRYGRATTDAQGQFHLSGIPPGRYSALAFDDVAGNEFYNPDFLNRYLNRSVEISVGDIADSTANPRLIMVQR